MRVGVWFVGALGGVATTAIAGALAIRRGLTSTRGLISCEPPFSGLSLPKFSEFVFGGHDVRAATLLESAAQIARESATLSPELLNALRDDLAEVQTNLRDGVLFHSGRAIERIGTTQTRISPERGGEAVRRLSEDLIAFRSRCSLDQLVVINVASTEPEIVSHPAQSTARGIDELLEQPNPPLIASSLYALASARAGAGYVNFTPSAGALLPGIREVFELRRLPFAGSDGKTGETLVKSALAPLFKYRNLRVLSWMGYNLLGDRDGEVLSEQENKNAKLRSKDQLLHESLGYPLHTKVEIDYVPSLGDFKTAWDFVHFQGFLETKMSLQFTWQGCDSVLAAPLVLDLARFVSFALQRQEAGALSHLALFFKSPVEADSHDLHDQYRALCDYARKACPTGRG